MGLESAIGFEAEAARLAVGLVLVAAALAKAMDFASFQTTLLALRAPGSIVRVAAMTFVTIEGGLGLFLVTGLRLRAAETAAVAFVTALVCVSAYAVVTRTDVPCACFGAGRRRLGSETLLLSSLLFGGLIFYVTVSQFGELGWRIGPQRLGDAFALALCNILICVWAMSIPTFARMYRQRQYVRPSLQ